MCRLFAVYAKEPVRVHRAFAAMRSQSHEHKDGWGVFTFDDGPKLETCTDSAHRSERFRELGQTMQARTMLAHIRLASVGAVSAPNSHPFFDEGWAFQHNGTVRGFAQSRERLESLLSPERRSRIKGDTDSERCFQLFLSRVKGEEPKQIAAALASVIRDVSAIFDEPGVKPSSMNFIAFNGRQLVATRHGRELHLLSRANARLISSEALWHDEPWEMLPEDSAIAIEPSLAVSRWSLGEL